MWFKRTSTSCLHQGTLSICLETLLVLMLQVWFDVLEEIHAVLGLSTRIVLPPRTTRLLFIPQFPRDTNQHAVWLHQIVCRQQSGSRKLWQKKVRNIGWLKPTSQSPTLGTSVNWMFKTNNRETTSSSAWSLDRHLHHNPNM